MNLKPCSPDQPALSALPVALATLLHLSVPLNSVFVCFSTRHDDVVGISAV